MRQGLRAYNDQRTVLADASAGYFGVEIDERSLVPGNNARLGETRFETWLTKSAKSTVSAVGAPR